MADSHRISQARELYRAFAAGDRSTVENLLAPSFSFSSPLDVGLDRSGFFERCWPGSGQGQSVEFVRLLEVGDTVVVTYERTGQDGRRGRNTEVLTFEGDQIGAAEVYFGWSL